MIEVRLAEEHVNKMLASEAIVTQMAVGSLLSKDAGKEFKKLIKRLTDGSE
ncbi:hypothetical protein [Marinobacter nauticus]|uniref:Uncharacterized protein n=1 Tax=Marinobacter nauticus TaxID=2743 RepID=A0A833JTC7_MARNT|nr:hypothetical protein [Marinobacter nauticus]KAE8546146.1 hypothetical protein F6453_1392 [Marinobacter nauticus]